MTLAPLIQFKNVTKKYKDLIAVNDLSLEINHHETLGLVGESGCGKSTTGKLLMRLEHPTSGDILFNDFSFSSLSREGQRELNKEMQIIFQDPYSSLNPRMTLGDIIIEPLVIHRLISKKQRKGRAQELLDLVGLDTSFAGRYPHEISGGQRQRVGIARALALKPKFIVCDEPLSALDVSIQAQIVNLLKKFQREMGLTYLFISHDLSMVKYLCDRIAVMYLGHLVELADARTLTNTPLHPYTQALLASIFIPDPQKEKERIKVPLKGDPFSQKQCRKGCPFAPRCPKAMDICHEELSARTEVSPGHFTSCHLYTS